MVAVVEGGLGDGRPVEGGLEDGGGGEEGDDGREDLGGVEVGEEDAEDDEVEGDAEEVVDRRALRVGDDLALGGHGR